MMEPILPQETLIAGLRKENEKLRLKLQEYESLAEKESTQSEEVFVNHVVKENEELKEKLQDFKKLEEDLMAQRVSERAKKQLTVWLTIGGLVIFIGGIIGFRQIEEYTRGLVEQKVQKVADDEIRRVLQEEGKKQVATIVEQQRGTLQSYANEQVKEIAARAVASGPLSVSQNQPTSVQSLALDPSIASKDYTAAMTIVRDEGSEGSVVGFAVAAALEYQIKKKLGIQVLISPRYIYYFARKGAGMDTSIDSGAFIKDAIKVLSEKGAVAEDAWPYKAGEYASNPPKAVDAAQKYKSQESRALKSL